MWSFKFMAPIGAGKWIVHFERPMTCGCGMDKLTRIFDNKPTTEQAENEVNNRG